MSETSMDGIVARAMSYCLADEARKGAVDLEDDEAVILLLRRASFSDREIEDLKPRAIRLVKEKS